MNKRDARRLAAARGVKYTVAYRELEDTDPKQHHALVLAAEAAAAGGNSRGGGESGGRGSGSAAISAPTPPPIRAQRWYERVAQDFAAGLLERSPEDVLTPPPGMLPVMDLAWYSMAGASEEDPQYVDEYEDGSELYNLSFRLDVSVRGELSNYVPRSTLQAAGIVPLAYTPNRPEVRLPVRRVRVEVAGLLDRNNDYSWEEQEVLSYDWL
ncbi:hypothetical protein [Cellulosimicrobium sp. Marseille-Q8652]